MVWKNFLIKRATKFETTIEYSLPILLNFIIAFGAYFSGKVWDTYSDNSSKKSFFEDIVLRSTVPLLVGNCSRFILTQAVKEKELGIYKSLLIMKLHYLTNGFSFILT